jgi:hypothetical protein
MDVLLMTTGETVLRVRGLLEASGKKGGKGFVAGGWAGLVIGLEQTRQVFMH